MIDYKTALYTEWAFESHKPKLNEIVNLCVTLETRYEVESTRVLADLCKEHRERGNALSSQLVGHAFQLLARVTQF